MTDTTSTMISAVAPTARTGELQMIVGPMMAGKSSELLRRVRRYQVAGLNVFIIKSTHDTRSAKDKIETHNGDGLAWHARTETLRDAIRELQRRETYTTGGTHNGSSPPRCHFDVVAIDEAQFFEDIVEGATLLADKGRIVITAGCDATYLRNPFKQYYRLLPHADEIIKLKAVCKRCKRDAIYTIQTGASRRIDSDEVIQPGGEELYAPVCRTCFLHPGGEPTTPTGDT